MNEKQRKGYIGGSDAPAILLGSEAKWTDPKTVWREITGRQTAEADPDDGNIQRGNALEDTAIEMYRANTDRPVNAKKNPKTDDCPDYIGGHVDGIIEGEDDAGVIEVKCPRSNTIQDIVDEGLPQDYIVQLHHYFLVTGCSWGSFAILDVDNWQLLHWDVDADVELIDELARREKEWWNKYVEKDICPPAGEDRGDTVDLPDTSGVRKRIEDPEAEQIGKELVEVRALKNQIEERENELKNALKGVMQDYGAEKAEIPGTLKLSWSKVDGRVSWKKTAQAIMDRRPIPAQHVRKVLQKETDIDDEIIEVFIDEEEIDLEEAKVTGSPYRRFQPTPQFEPDIQFSVSEDQ